MMNPKMQMAKTPYVSGAGDAYLKSSVWQSVMAQKQDRFAKLMMNTVSCFICTNICKTNLESLLFVIHQMFLLPRLGPSKTLKFEKQNEAHCMGTYGNYSTLSEAVSACTLDDSCGKIYSYMCDSGGGFQLCPVRSQHRTSHVNSCLYIKPGKIF